MSSGTANAGSCSSTARHFRLGGPSSVLDARTHAFRRDLADVALAGQIIAPHYAKPLPRACGVRAAPVLAAALDGAAQLSELLPGEPFLVLEYAGGWAWGYCGNDHVVGYVEAIELTAPAAPSHVVCEKCAPVTADGSIAAPVLAHLPMGARLLGEERGACLISDVGCVPLSHLRRTGECEEDPVTVAERLMGAPYKKGGRSMHGIDSPGLIQLALGLCGSPVPRLPEQQVRLGRALEPTVLAKRGDLVAFDGHVGMMIDDLLMIHASPEAGRVVTEPLGVVATRHPVLDRRRLG